VDAAIAENGPSAAARPAAATPRPALDAAVAAVADQRTKFARIPPAEKAALLRSLLPRFIEVGEEWVKAGCQAKGLAYGTPAEGEEWLAGVGPSVRYTRLLAESVEAIARKGRPPLGRGVRTRKDGRVEVDVLPAGGFDGVTLRGLNCSVLLLPGIDEAAARERQASFYQRHDPPGGVSLILGAGNVSSIPLMDVLTKMFIDGNVCILKMNPVNEWVGPHLERALAPLIDRGYLRIVYGGAEVGSYLCYHPARRRRAHHRLGPHARRDRLGSARSRA